MSTGLLNVLPATGDFSVFVTAVFAANYQGGARMLLSNNNGQAGRIDFGINGDATTPNRLTFFLGGSPNFAIALTDSVDTPVLFDGGWHEVGISRTGTTFQLHVDGAPAGAPGTSSLAPSTNTNFLIGRRTAYSGFFNNRISEVQVFDEARTSGVALAPAPVPWVLPPAPPGRRPAVRDPYGATPGVLLANSPDPATLFLGSPSIAILPDGGYVAAQDFFGTGAANLPTRIFRSQDRGASWTQVAEVHANQSNLFVHRGALYLMGPSGDSSQVVIRRSDDAGSSWTEPSGPATGVLLEDGAGGFHSSPQPVVEHAGRLWRSMEDCNGRSTAWGACFRAFVMSAPAGADLLDAASWTSTPRLASAAAWLGGQMNGWLEGNAVVAPDGSVKNILRVDTDPNQDDIAAMIGVSADGAAAAFDPAADPAADGTGFLTLPGATKKFVIRRDAVGGYYWTLSNYILPQDLGGNPERTRNTLALLRSPDLVHWEVRSVLLHHPDVATCGFHYADWQFDGDDIVALSRSAWDGRSQHDSNIILFHRFAGFRDLTPADSVPTGAAAWEFADFTVAGSGFRPLLLAEGERAFSNRAYVWAGVPPALAGCLVTRGNGGDNPAITVTAGRATTLRVATADPDGPAGWAPEGPLFHYTDAGNTPMHVFSLPLAAGEAVAVPQLAWSGTLVLVPPPHGLLARWQCEADGLPALADSRHAFHLGRIEGDGPRPVQGVDGGGLQFSQASSGSTGENVLGMAGLDFTLSAWLRTAPGDALPGQAILGKGNDLATAAWVLALGHPAAPAGHASFAAGSPQAAVSSPAPVNDDRWHHLAITFDASAVMTLHVDGSPVASTAAPPLPLTTAGLFLGGPNGTPSFRGAVDEVRIYDRLLSDAEVRSLFLNPAAAGQGPAALPLELARSGDSLLLRWPAIPGRRYHVLRSHGLAPPVWQPEAELTAAGDALEWPLDTTAQPHGFFRVELADP